MADPQSDHGTWNRGSPVAMPSGAGAGVVGVSSTS